MSQSSFRKVAGLTTTLLFFVFPLCAQFSQGRLQATGLTCALCSKSIHQALDQLPFTESVNPDLKSSSFDIRFKMGQPVSALSIRTAVEDAGFFVGQLRLEPTSDIMDSLRSGNPFQSAGIIYRLLEEWREGKRLLVIGKGFLTEKEYKRLDGRYPELSKEVDSVVYLLPEKK